MLISVALPLPLFQPYTYEVPDELAARATVGSRVVVPVRGRREMGFVVGEGVARAGVAVKRILSAPDDRPVLDRPLLDLCAWISEYYATPLASNSRLASNASNAPALWKPPAISACTNSNSA